jgi:hypothetical protein
MDPDYFGRNAAITKATEQLVALSLLYQIISAAHKLRNRSKVANRVISLPRDNEVAFGKNGHQSDRRKFVARDPKR